MVYESSLLNVKIFTGSGLVNICYMEVVWQKDIRIELLVKKVWRI